MPTYPPAAEIEIDDETAAGILVNAENVRYELEVISKNQCHLILHVWMVRREDGVIALRAWGVEAELRVEEVAALRPEDRREVLHRFLPEWATQAA
jgi:hypothetical protein